MPRINNNRGSFSIGMYQANIKPRGQAQRDILCRLPQAVVAGGVLSLLDSKSLAHFFQTSKISNNDATKSAIIQLQRLNEELNQLITDSEITGIQNPKGPFKNHIHELQVLTAFKDALPNAISVLKDNGITDINERDDRSGKTPLHLAARDNHTEPLNA